MVKGDRRMQATYSYGLISCIEKSLWNECGSKSVPTIHLLARFFVVTIRDENRRRSSIGRFH
jgi:hypothetical protein